MESVYHLVIIFQHFLLKSWCHFLATIFFLRLQSTVCIITWIQTGFNKTSVILVISFSPVNHHLFTQSHPLCLILSSFHAWHYIISLTSNLATTSAQYQEVHRRESRYSFSEPAGKGLEVNLINALLSSCPRLPSPHKRSRINSVLQNPYTQSFIHYWAPQSSMKIGHVNLFILFFLERFCISDASSVVNEQFQSSGINIYTSPGWVQSLWIKSKWQNKTHCL